MPKLAPLKITVRSEDDKRFEHTVVYPLSVDSSGQFYVEIDQEFEQAYEKACQSLGQGRAIRICDKPTRGYKRDRTRVIAGKNLDSIKAALVAFGESMLQTEVETELRIFYKLDTRCHYFKTEAGKILPNGVDAPDGNWVSTPSNFYRGMEIGVSAVIAEVKTTKLSTGERSVSYTSRFDAEKLGPAGKELNKFTRQHFPQASRGEPDTMPSIPYTEAGAQLFVDVLFAMCSIADRLEMELGDAEALPAKIEAGMIALMPPAGESNNSFTP